MRVILLTTLEAWRAPLDEPLRAGEDAVRVPDEASILAIADEAFPSGQVVALDVTEDTAGLDGRAVDGGRVSAVRFVRRGPDGRHTALLVRPEIAEALDLLPHPEGGWFRETWRTAARLVPQGYPGERATATGIYFLLPAGEESMWHRVRSDETWFHHLGDPLVLELGGAGERPGPAERIVLGRDLRRGERPQALVPAGVWQAARPAGPAGALVSCVVSPGFDFADFSVPP